MNYPFWDIPFLGGSMLIAIIAILHVIVSHLAVGGGFYLFLAELKYSREKDVKFLAYLKSHARFFMLLTTVFGAVSGVGIWFVIALVSPAATSTLIHIFLYGWAIEWVFFLVEILAVILYVYKFDSLTQSSRIQLAFIYMAAAWLSLFIINGIITFMLTPGDYYFTSNFFSAFFNPTFLPSLLFRTVVCIAFAGIFAMFTATFQFEEELREKAVKYASAYLLPALIFMPLFALWYFAVLPGLARDIVTGASALILIFANISAGSAFLMLAAGIAHAWIEPKRFSTIFTILLIIFASTFLATFELVREAVRKPYTLYNRMYSNSIYVDKHNNPEIDPAGFLANLKWCDIKKIDDSNLLAAGREIYRYQCQACHSIEGYNAIRPLVKYWSADFCEASLLKLNTLKKFMPPFFGNDDERRALAHYLFSLNNKIEDKTARR
ncbi:MAG TPA: cytochrome ubiquinol oxidase subunit I [Candidatus Wallbacteria bacterium]|nr:cytochrome ubiquinol oxidase subunit I [Candidatus Wallbacteria bacterium]